MNDLQRELLTMLAEEAGELVQACTKALRHGLDSYHPDHITGPNNQQAIQNELCDVSAVALMLDDAGVDIDPDGQDILKTMKTKQRWMHNRIPGKGEVE